MMGNTNFTTSIQVTKSPQSVFKCISEDVSKWWGGKDLQGNTTKVDDEFIIHHKGTHYSNQKLIQIIPYEKIVWLVTESTLDWLQNDKLEWTNTRMIFEITTKEDKTILHFTHEGLIPEKECYAKCEQGWNMVINDWLFQFITQGKPHFKF